MLDLGAAPGSWTLYASEKVGKKGRVVAIDLKEIAGAFAENVTVLQGDVLAPDPPPAFLEHAPYAVVLSDMAPNTTGSKTTDQARSFELFMKALSVATRFGAEKSSFVGKIFMSGDFPEAKKAVTELYEECRVLKPEGTRSNSTEIFVIGVRKKTGPAGP